MNEFTGERVIPGLVNEELWAEHVSRYTFAARFAKGAAVLDIGSGTGYGTAELAQHARYAIGVDVAVDAVNYARSEYRRKNTTFLQASAEALPLPNASFDLVTAFEVIEHLNDWNALLREASRVMKPEGVCLISTPNKPYYAYSRGTKGPNPFHTHEFDAEEFATTLRAFFPHIQMLLQNRVEAFAFYPYNTFLPVDARMDGSRGTPADSTFFLAVCSQNPIQNLRTFIYVPRASNILWERERYIESLKHQLSNMLSEREKHIASLKLELTNMLSEREKHIASLKLELNTARQERDEIIQKHTELNVYLEQQNRWAKELDTELEIKRAHLATVLKELEELRQNFDIAVAALDKAEKTVVERTLWAVDLQNKVNLLEASTMVKLGQAIHVIPKPEEES